MRKPMGNKGFTLVELMVVVCIIGLLAAVAIPQYQYSAIKAKRAEVILICNTVYKAQTAHWAAHERYLLPPMPDADYPNKCDINDVDALLNGLHSDIADPVKLQCLRDLNNLQGLGPITQTRWGYKFAYHIFLPSGEADFPFFWLDLRGNVDGDPTLDEWLFIYSKNGWAPPLPRYVPIHMVDDISL